jgi:hypothetical protein
MSRTRPRSKVSGHDEFTRVRPGVGGTRRHEHRRLDGSGPQPGASGVLCVHSVPDRPLRPRFWTIWTHRTGAAVRAAPGGMARSVTGTRPRSWQPRAAAPKAPATPATQLPAPSLLRRRRPQRPPPHDDQCATTGDRVAPIARAQGCRNDDDTVLAGSERRLTSVAPRARFARRNATAVRSLGAGRLAGCSGGSWHGGARSVVRVAWRGAAGGLAARPLVDERLVDQLFAHGDVQRSVGQRQIGPRQRLGAGRRGRPSPSRADRSRPAGPPRSCCSSR